MNDVQMISLIAERLFYTIKTVKYLATGADAVLKKAWNMYNKGARFKVVNYLKQVEKENRIKILKGTN